MFNNRKLTKLGYVHMIIKNYIMKSFFSIESIYGMVSKINNTIKYHTKFNHIFEKERQIHKKDWNNMLNGGIMDTFFV